MKEIKKSDLAFLKRRIMPYFGVKKLYMDYKETDYVFPDCWVDMNSRIPVITVTQEWARQSMDERRKRLVHEVGHIFGYNHGIINGLRYDTHPEKDDWSRYIYGKIK